ncbi:trypsin-like serine peptidase, partial [Streptomyces sp. NPDC058953]|uniref:trypsin-like serine peptidase n=1 Tax=Streptomyces sp. NPDC058953 TaxID=3346676 RepID=UPI0036B7B187
MVCSATVVKDPANPGRSNLVWTAGHCVHAGAEGGWYRNVVFVPAYNSRGLSRRELASAAPSDVAPFGSYWADGVATSDQWIRTGDASDGTGASYDYAVVRVKPGAGGASLEETVGAALDVDFAAAQPHTVKSLVVRGYPAARPYDGALMHSCTGRPGRFAFEADNPVMWRMGCSMTGGSSGGGWFVDRDGTPVLVSNTSIGPADPVWLAGPRLGKEAERILTTLSASSTPATADPPVQGAPPG